MSMTGKDKDSVSFATKLGMGMVRAEWYPAFLALVMLIQSCGCIPVRLHSNAELF
jgi:hypothetical protein